jgi:dihydrofolate synthase/folylpolyglutamate synthase
MVIGKFMKDLTHSLERLYALRTFGIKPGLETTLALLGRLGDPQHSFAAIHVAGTNGKGSVCAMLESVLRKTGLRVGLYTSPHLIRFNERIRVNGVEIGDEALAALFEDLEPHAGAVAANGREATFFEFTTALAFEHFRREKVQVAVVETGMGGRLDSTNVLTPLISVITRIGLEHTAYLGDTVAAIAGEKAGIIKPGRPVVCGATPDEALAVIRKIAESRKAPFIRVEDSVALRRVAQDLNGQKVSITGADVNYGPVILKLLGKHQLENCATAVAALESLATCSPLAIPPELICAGLAEAVWPGRLDLLSREPPVILDGAHNPDGARTLAAALHELFKKKKVALVWGMCDDKDALGFAKALGAGVKRCWTVPIDTERSLAPEKLLQIARTEGWQAVSTTLPEALEQAKSWARENDGAVCIAGSLFLAGEVLKRVRREA